MYYKGFKLDPNFPAPKPPVPIAVPSERPEVGDKSHLLKEGTTSGGGQHATSSSEAHDHTTSAERQKILAEVREHLALLKEFEGAVSEEDLNRRKRALFLALPPAPPPAGTKRMKTDSAFSAL